MAAPLVAVSLTLVSACSSSAGKAATPAAQAYSGVAADLGTPKPASGTPVLFGTLSAESGPVTFPEGRAAAEAAIAYLNEYRGGIGGHPLKLEHCVTDATPASSARCANQLLDAKPKAILGTLDLGVPAAMAVWERAKLPYLGGVTFTPVEQNSPMSVQFSSLTVADNASTAVYIGQHVKAKSVAVLSDDSAVSLLIVNSRLIPTLKAAGVTRATSVTYPPTAADLTSTMATALTSKPDVIYVASASACVNAFRALKALGSTAKLAGASNCADQGNLDQVKGAADGMYFASPFQPLDSDQPDPALFRAVMTKYAPTASRNSVAQVSFSTVMNVQAALADKDPATLTTDSILAAFRTGSDHPSFMTHPYTCDGKQLVRATSVCDSHELVYQVKNGRSVLVDGLSYITPGSFFAG